MKIVLQAVGLAAPDTFRGVRGFSRFFPRAGANIGSGVEGMEVVWVS